MAFAGGAGGLADSAASALMVWIAVRVSILLLCSEIWAVNSAEANLILVGTETHLRVT